MTMAADALQILEQVQPGRTTLTEKDIKVLWCAITRQTNTPMTWSGEPKPLIEPPEMHIGMSGVITFRSRMIRELGGVERISFGLAGPFPCILADPEGAKIIRNPARNSAQVIAVAIKREVARLELLNTTWQMERTQHGWVGVKRID